MLFCSSQHVLGSMHDHLGLVGNLCRGTVLQSKSANFVVFNCYIYIIFEFMGGDNKHLYSFVRSHILSCDPGVTMASFSELIWETLLSHDLFSPC